jgi:AraC-like DNA-binding protein
MHADGHGACFTDSGCTIRAMELDVRYCTAEDGIRSVAKTLPSRRVSADLTALSLAQFRPAPGRLVMPDVCCDLVWVRGCLTLTGPMTQAVESRNVGADITLLRLDPLVAYRLFGTPLSCFTDRVVKVADINQGLADELEGVMRSGHLAGLVRCPSRAPAGVDERLSVAVDALRRRTTVAAVASKIGISERHLERIFFEQMGLSPKTFARIIRFRRALKSANTGASLAHAAATAGYADQAHLSRDTRDLTGASPSAILRHVGNVQDVVAGTM